MQSTLKIENQLISYNRNLNPHFYAIHAGKGLKFICGMAGGLAFYEINRMIKLINSDPVLHHELEIDHNAGNKTSAIILLKRISEHCLKFQTSVWIDMDISDEIDEDDS